MVVTFRTVKILVLMISWKIRSSMQFPSQTEPNWMEMELSMKSCSFQCFSLWSIYWLICTTCWTSSLLLQCPSVYIINQYLVSTLITLSYSQRVGLTTQLHHMDEPEFSTLGVINRSLHGRSDSFLSKTTTTHRKSCFSKYTCTLGVNCQLSSICLSDQ